MRSALSVVALVVAVFALVMVFLNPKGPQQQSQSSDEVARLMARVSALERRVAGLQSGLDDLSAELADARNPIPFPRPQKSNPPAPSVTPQPTPDEASSSSSATAASGQENLRKLVREEITRYFSNRQSRRRGFWRGQSGKEAQPEDWEKKEFGDFAGWIHYVGEKVGMDVQQRREYYRIIKDYYDKAGKLWERIREEMKDKSWQQRRRRYWEQSRELLKQTRAEILDILTPQQQEKYRKLFNDDIWPDR